MVANLSPVAQMFMIVNGNRIWTNAAVLRHRFNIRMRSWPQTLLAFLKQFCFKYNKHQENHFKTENNYLQIILWQKRSSAFCIKSCIYPQNYALGTLCTLETIFLSLTPCDKMQINLQREIVGIWGERIIALVKTIKPSMFKLGGGFQNMKHR